MAYHHVTIAGVAGAWQGQCACRQRGPVEEAHWDAERWTAAHMKEVQRLRSHRGFGPGSSLQDQHDYYQAKAEDVRLGPHERELWAQLAGELRQRLGLDHPHNDPPLF